MANFTNQIYNEYFTFLSSFLCNMKYNYIIIIISRSPNLDTLALIIYSASLPECNCIISF